MLYCNKSRRYYSAKATSQKQSRKLAREVKQALKQSQLKVSR